MKIFLVSQQFVGTVAGGEAVHVMELARALKKRNYDIRVLTLGIGSQPLCEECDLGSTNPARVPVLRFFTADSEKIRSPYEGSFEDSIRRAREFGLQITGWLRAQPDQAESLVHLHGHYMIPSLAKEIRKTTDFRIVSTIHRAESIYEALGLLHHPERVRLMHEKEQDAINSSDRIVVRSKYVRDYLLELYQHRIRDNFAVVPSAVGEAFAAAPLPSPAGADAIKKKHGLHGEVILIFGVFEPLKGFEFALQSLPLLKKKLRKQKAGRRAVTLVLAGLLRDNHRDYFAKLQKITKKLSPPGLKRSVRFLPNVDEETKNDLYDMADIFLYTPVAEPFGISLAEAAAREKICIASDCEGPRHILNCSEPVTGPFLVCGNGILFRNEFSRRCEHIAQALLYALTHRDELRIAAENGRRFALKSLSWRQLINAKTALYKSVMEEQRKGVHT